jgi:tripartite-type tricarboxylate transporter receptor subunit TctC
VQRLKRTHGLGKSSAGCSNIGHALDTMPEKEVKSSSLPPIQGGKLRGLAVTTAKRTPAVPNLPPIAEAGVPGFDVSSWYALFVPARTPPEIIGKMHADTVAALTDPVTKERLEQLGVVVVGSSPAELAAFLKAEMDKWAPVIKEAGITIRE